MSPEETLELYFNSLTDGHYDRAAGLFTEGVLERFRTDLAPMLRPPPPATVEGYLQRSPDLPRAVAEFWVSNSRKQPVTLGDYFAGIETEGELAALSSVELYARHLEASDHTARHVRLIDRLRARYPQYSDQLLELRASHRSGWQFVTFGVVERGARAYVLFGHSLPDGPQPRYEPTPHVAVFYGSGDGWRLASDPSPYAGMGVVMGRIEVTDGDGQIVTLDPFEPA